MKFKNRKIQNRRSKVINRNNNFSCILSKNSNQSFNYIEKILKSKKESKDKCDRKLKNIRNISRDIKNNVK